MGCLFSKRTAAGQEDLMERSNDDRTGSVSDDSVPVSDDSVPLPSSLAASGSRSSVVKLDDATQSTSRSSVAEPNAVDSTAAPTMESKPDVLKAMGRGGFADITTGIQEQLGSWQAPLNPSEDGQEGQRYITNENGHELQLGKTLGKGNYGEVYAGTWRGKKVAVKKVLLPHDMSQTQQRRLVEDFKCEVDICCRLTHPRLVDFLGYTTVPDLCIVQELMNQGSLYDQFRRGWRAKSFEQQLVLAHDIARGMAYLHAWRPPLIHRDLKSLNILVSAGQPSDSGTATTLARCKVTDFGMTRAKAMGQTTEAEAMASGATPAQVMTLAMTRCGTPFWTAPEIIQGATYNETVDQYAYACVCLEILTGAPPWQKPPSAGQRGGGGGQIAPMNVMQMVVQGKRPALPETNPQLASLIQKCWAQEPSSRPSFKQVVSYLKQLAKSAGFVLPRD